MLVKKFGLNRSCVCPTSQYLNLNSLLATSFINTLPILTNGGDDSDAVEQGATYGPLRGLRLLFPRHLPPVVPLLLHLQLSVLECSKTVLYLRNRRNFFIFNLIVFRNAFSNVARFFHHLLDHIHLKFLEHLQRVEFSIR